MPGVPVVGAPGPRRIVTGLGADGRSTILFDDRVEIRDMSFLKAGLVWRAPHLPAPDSGAADMGAGGYPLEMPGTASNFAVFRIEPTPDDAEVAMHAIPTIDCIVVLEGRVELFTETGSVVVEAGDLVVDRGVKHGWRALDGKPATTVVVNIPAQAQG